VISKRVALRLADHHLAVFLDELRLVLDKQHAHRLTEVRGRRIEHLAAGLRVETDGHGRPALRVGGLRVRELIARGDHVAAQQVRLPGAFEMLQLEPERRPAPAFGLGGIVLGVDEVELERRRGAEHALRLARVLDARQLHEDTVEALPLHDGFRDAELVHAVAQRERVLLNREVLALFERRLGEPQGEPGAAVDRRRLDVETTRELAELDQLIARVELADDLLGASEVGRLDDSHLERVVRHAQVVADVRLAQLRAQVALVGPEVLADRGAQVHLVEKVHTAAQIEPERHRLQTHGLEPLRGARCERQRDDIVRQHLRDRFVGAQLFRRSGEADDRGLAVDRGRQVRDFGVVERLRELRQRGRVDGFAIRARDVHRFVVAEDIRQRQEQRHGDDAEYEDVHPKRVTVHECGALKRS
jgi:hypothetical protein